MFQPTLYLMLLSFPFNLNNINMLLSRRDIIKSSNILTTMSLLNNNDTNNNINQDNIKLEKHKDKRLKTIFHERYFCGSKGKLKPWKEVAKKINLSAQGCINLHDKAVKELNYKINNEKIKF